MTATLNTEFLLAIIGFLVLILFMYYGKYYYWKAKAENYKYQIDNSDGLGWESEAHFWRMHFNKDAAKEVNELFS